MSNRPSRLSAFDDSLTGHAAGQGPEHPPRLAGTHGTCLRIVREQGIPLMQVLAASSYNPARYLGETELKSMRERGRMQGGMIADITILDPNTVRVNVTDAKGRLPTTDIPFVMVNGMPVVKDSVVLKGANPGLPIRFPTKGNARFKPLSEEAWKNEFRGSPVGFGGLDREGDYHSSACAGVNRAGL